MVDLVWGLGLCHTLRVVAFYLWWQPLNRPTSLVLWWGACVSCWTGKLTGVQNFLNLIHFAGLQSQSFEKLWTNAIVLTSGSNSKLFLGVTIENAVLRSQGPMQQKTFHKPWHKKCWVCQLSECVHGLMPVMCIALIHIYHWPCVRFVTNNLEHIRTDFLNSLLF